MRTIALVFLLICLTVSTAEAGHKKKSKKTSASDLVTMIDRAKKKLADRAIGTSVIGGDNALLAVWKSGTAKLAVVKVRKGVSKTKGYQVTLLKRNGVNSEYRVDEPEGWVVLALKTNIRARMGRGKKKRAVAAVYAPYGPHLDDAALIARGRRYLIDLIARAGKRLDARAVDSKVDASERVTETVSSKILVTLLVIEHVSPDDFDDRGVEPVVHRVFSLVGANREDAYDYAVSDAHAGGIAQFISETYGYTRDRYEEAKLEDDYVKGMRDHCNAAMAQYCLADWSITQLPSDAYAKLMRREEDLGAFIAAAYNGGEKRAAKAYEADPDHWEKAGNGLAAGTVTYVREFRAIYRYLWDS